jgi:hypothetical protein
MDQRRRSMMAKDPAMSGPVSKLEGGAYESSEEVRAKDAGENIPDETGEGLTRSEIINMFGEGLGRMLLDAGYASITSLRLASDDELLAISGLGPAKVNLIRELVGVQEVAEDEAMMPELAGLPFGEPAPPPVEEVMETALDDSPRFGDPGSVNPRIARIRAAAEAQAEEEARLREATRAAEIAAAGGVVELEAEIEVEEVSEPEPEPEPEDEIVALSEDGAEVEHIESETLETVGGENAVAEEAEEEEAPSE